MVDLKTIVFCIVLVESFLALAMFLYWKTQKTYPGFHEWIFSLFIVLIGHLLLTQRGIYPDFIAVSVANTFVVLAFAVILDSLNRYFLNRSFDRKLYLLFIPLMLTFYFFTEYIEYAQGRNLIVSITTILLLILIVRLLLTVPNSNEKFFSSLLAGIFILLGFTFVGRVIEWALDPSSTDIFKVSFFNISILVIILMSNLGTTLLFLFLNIQKATLELDATKTESQDYANRYSLAVSSASAGMWEIDLKSGEVLWDNSLEGLLSSENDIAGRLTKIWESFEIAGQYKANPEETCAHIDKSDYLVTQLSLSHNNGGMCHLMVHAQVLCDGVGSDRVMGLVYDITNLHNAESALKETNRKLNLLTSITRHDILNKANAVIGFAEILADSLEDPDQKKMVDIIAESGEAITRLITFTKYYQNLGTNDPTWQDISILLNDIEFLELAGDKTLTFPDSGVLIYADEMLKKVLYNFIENSLRHGGDVSSFSFSYEFSEENLTLVYQDDGVGIPEENKDMIFEKGYGEHTGMGLFFCREVLEITGFSLRETGVPGQGARFETTVPSGYFKKN